MNALERQLVEKFHVAPEEAGRLVRAAEAKAKIKAAIIGSAAEGQRVVAADEDIDSPEAWRDEIRKRMQALEVLQDGVNGLEKCAKLLKRLIQSEQKLIGSKTATVNHRGQDWWTFNESGWAMGGREMFAQIIADIFSNIDEPKIAKQILDKIGFKRSIPMPDDIPPLAPATPEAQEPGDRGKKDPSEDPSENPSEDPSRKVPAHAAIMASLVRGASMPDPNTTLQSWFASQGETDAAKDSFLATTAKLLSKRIPGTKCVVKNHSLEFSHKKFSGRTVIKSNGHHETNLNGAVSGGTVTSTPNTLAMSIHKLAADEGGSSPWAGGSMGSEARHGVKAAYSVPPKVKQLNRQLEKHGAELVEALGGGWMILVHGFQWGGHRDASGAGDATWKTPEEAFKTFMGSEARHGVKAHAAIMASLVRGDNGDDKLYVERSGGRWSGWVDTSEGTQRYNNLPQDKAQIERWAKSKHLRVVWVGAKTVQSGSTVKAMNLTPNIEKSLLRVLEGYIGSDWKSLKVEQVWLHDKYIRFTIRGRYIVAKRAAQKFFSQHARSKGFTATLLKRGDDGYLTVDITITPELEKAAESLGKVSIFSTTPVRAASWVEDRWNRGSLKMWHWTQKPYQLFVQEIEGPGTSLYRVHVVGPNGTFKMRHELKDPKKAQEAAMNWYKMETEGKFMPDFSKMWTKTEGSAIKR